MVEKLELEIFKSVFYNVSIPIFICDKKLKILYHNNALCELTALTNNEIWSQKITKILPALKKKEVLKTLNNAVSLGLKESIEIKALFNERDTKEKKSVLTLCPINAQNKVIGFVERLENQNNKKMDNERLPIFEFLVKGIAHEIRNPLAIIKSNTQYCLRYFNCNLELTKPLKSIGENVNFADKFLDQVLTITDNKLNMKLALVNKLIKNTVNLVKTKLDIKHISVNLELNRIAKSYLDEVKIEEVFLNLLLNSCNVLDDGGSISIKSLFDKETNSIKIHFIDNGRGIPKNHLKEIFYPFFTIGRSGKGLGLAICKNIIENHNGTIFANKVNRKGAFITIQLPFNKSLPACEK